MRAFASFILFLLTTSITCVAQTYSISGHIKSSDSSRSIPSTQIKLKGSTHGALADSNGHFKINHVRPGNYILVATSPSGRRKQERTVVVEHSNLVVNFYMPSDTSEQSAVSVKNKRVKTFGISRLDDVDGTSIYAGKKTEVVVMDDITANTATNNSRQVYGKVAGLNIWENDGAGIQLGIGGRGLNPNRVSNFNTRQNGYDISADALGYPESYYTPPTEGLDRIEVIRGAASLQYGTQFGGLINFRMKNGPTDKKIQLVSRQTGGSFGFFNSFNSLGGNVGKFNYYVYYHHKQGNGWRPNSEFNVNGAYASVTYKANARLSVTGQYTFMQYLAHQPGGLTDQMFENDPRQSVRDRNWFKVNWNLFALMADYKVNERLKFNTRFFGLLANRSVVGILDPINRLDHGGNRDLWSDDFKNWGNETRMLYNYNLRKNTAVFLIGFRYYNGHTQQQQGQGNNGSTGTKQDFKFNNPGEPEYALYDYPNHNYAIFAENIFRLSKRFSVIPGVRYERIQTNAQGYYNIVNKDLAGNIIFSQRVDEDRSNTRSFLLGGIGLSYKKSDSLQLYANISQNYRAINFNDMRITNPNLRIDPNLQDERGYSADAGVRGNIWGFLNYDFSIFLLNYANRIGTVMKTDPTTFNIYRLRTNISQSYNLGMETFAEVDILKILTKGKSKARLSVFSNVTVVQARYVNSKEPAYEGNKVEYAPGLLVKSGVTYKKKRLTASYQVSYTSQQYSDATNATYTANAIIGIIPSYYVMDLSMEYSFNSWLSTYASINNLSNNMYFTRRAEGYPGPGIIPSDARSFFLTLQVKL